jgi:hypothetical protein
MCFHLSLLTLEVAKKPQQFPKREEKGIKRGQYADVVMLWVS